MKFEIETIILNKILKNILQISFSLYSKPEWNGILITVFEEKIEFEVKNDFLSFKKTIEKNQNLKIEKKGRILVKTKIFGDIISKITDETVKIFTIGENVLLIKSINFSYELNLMDEKEFQEIKFNFAPGIKLKIKFEKFKGLINKVIFSGNERSSRKILQGIHLIAENKILKAFATDNVRIAFYKIILEETTEINKIIPIKVLKEILKIFESNEIINFNFFQNDFTVTTDQTIIQANLIEGNFPEVEKMFPEKFKNTLTIQKKELLRIIEGSIVLNFNRESNTNIVKLIFSDQLLNVEFRELEIGFSNLKTSKFEFDGDKNFFISFNPKLLFEALRIIENEKIIIKFNNYDSPFVLFDEQNFKCLILPFKIN